MSQMIALNIPVPDPTSQTICGISIILIEGKSLNLDYVLWKHLSTRCLQFRFSDINAVHFY